MGRQFKTLKPKHTGFIERQKLFFVGTAAPKGSVNVSPKGMDTLRVLSPCEVLWLNLTGSGNETAAHLNQISRMTLMFCAFEGPPLILRLYGRAEAFHDGHPFWKEHIGRFPHFAGSRQLIRLEVDLVQTSCGMGVPLMDYTGERDLLEPWARERGPKGMVAYRQEKNRTSLDGYDTGLPG